jgi:hypothetical protein
MLNVDNTTSESRQQVDFSMVEQVIVLALKPWVRFLLDFKLDVTRKHPRHLVTFTSEIDLVAGLNSSIYVNVQYLALDNGFLSQTSLAPIFLTNRLSLALAVRTDSLESLDHRPHLPHHGLHARAVATRASLYRAFFATASVTGWADYGFLQGKFRHFAAIDVFEGNLVNVVDDTCFLWACFAHSAAKHPAKGTAATEELSEQIFSVHASTAAALFQSLFAILIVELTFLGVRKNFIGFGEFFEYFGGLRVVGIFVCQEARSVLCPDQV